ncbi:MAG: AAA family ATPase [Firmicutes bacterium]|nr:AAA family ATPase [Bacillota bacterium]
MTDYKRSFELEKAYLAETIEIIRRELAAEAEALAKRRDKIIGLRAEMWRNTAYASQDFAKLTEINQYLAEVDSQTTSYLLSSTRLKKYQKMLSAPYFGRIDFREDQSSEADKIYIGLANVIDPKTQNIQVYDWRAPISSLFYRSGLGQASYEAPMGKISGEVLLKRQYKIKDGKLEYFFDSSIRVTDEILQELLARNASPQMRNIVETIQKEQDIIIRDTTSDLLIVQGIAGSGKTSIALHRVAFLLYEGPSGSLSPENILIISPNELFSAYTANVLPELGEENVQQITFHNLLKLFFKKRFVLESREEQLEHIHQSPLRQEAAAFKGSREFVQILDRLLRYYARKKIPFEDLYYHGQIIATRQELKSKLLNSKLDIPLNRQLSRLKEQVLAKIKTLQKTRLQQIEKFVNAGQQHPFDAESFSRLLSIKRTRPFLEQLKQMTHVDYWQVYKLLFTDEELFFKLAKGIPLPDRIQEIITDTAYNLKQGLVCCEDAAALAYLYLKVEGSKSFSEIKHVVIDEAQDYDSIHYTIFKLLFPESRYTILGDLNQTIAKNLDDSFYDEIIQLLQKTNPNKAVLTTGYRSTYEINRFTQKILGRGQAGSFARHGEEPQVVAAENEQMLLASITQDVGDFLKQGYNSVAIVCKSRAQAEKVYADLKGSLPVKLVTPNLKAMEQGVMVIPVYLAKGLEFDVALVYDANEENYASELERKLLYVACTRALHQLKVYYTGKASPFLKQA